MPPQAQPVGGQPLVSQPLGHPTNDGPANGVRPSGDKGCNESTYTHTDINGFWVEYPGSKNMKWQAPMRGPST